MEREAAERDDTGGVEHRGRARSVFEIEPTLERRSRLGQLPHPQQQAAPRGFEHLVGPAVPAVTRSRAAPTRSSAYASALSARRSVNEARTSPQDSTVSLASSRATRACST